MVEKGLNLCGHMEQKLVSPFYQKHVVEALGIEKVDTFFAAESLEDQVKVFNELSPELEKLIR